MFRHVLNFVRTGNLTVPENFDELDLLLEEAKFFELIPLIRAVENLKRHQQQRQSPIQPARSQRIQSQDFQPVPKRSRWNGPEDLTTDGARRSSEETESRYNVECVVMNVSPDLGERITLSADRFVLENLFPELDQGLLDGSGSGKENSGEDGRRVFQNLVLDSRYIIRFPLNGYCKVSSVEVMQKLMSKGFEICASNGGGVEGQQFSEYVFSRKTLVESETETLRWSGKSSEGQQQLPKAGSSVRPSASASSLIGVGIKREREDEYE